MVHEGDCIACVRNSWVADPATGLIQNLVHRELEAILATRIAHHGQGVAIGRPIGPLHLVLNFSGSAAGQRHSRQRAGVDIGANLLDRKSTRLNSSHLVISYAVFCLKKKKKKIYTNKTIEHYTYDTLD